MGWNYFSNELLRGKNQGLNDHIKHLYRYQSIRKLIGQLEPNLEAAQKQFDNFKDDSNFENNLSDDNYEQFIQNIKSYNNKIQTGKNEKSHHRKKKNHI